MVKNRLLILVIIFLALQFLLLKHASAEYRVFLLGVKSSAKAKETKVLSTLDDLQYQTYYKITPDQETRLIDHWMCWGRTNDFKKLCSKPILKQASSRAPASAQGPVPAASSQQLTP